MDWNDAALTPLAGGYSGETFVASTSAAFPEYVVRIYARNPDRAPVDAALLRLVRGLVPVPEVLELRPATSSTPAVLVTEYVRSVSLEDVLADPPDDLDWESLGLEVGWLLGTLSNIPFVRHGMFVDADLGLSNDGLPDDLAAWAQHHRDDGRLAAWADADWVGLRELVDLAGEVLDEAGPYDDRAVLVHSDLNPKNVLLDVEGLDVVALVDWEFAHAGSIHTDFGNFTRFERDDRLVEPLIEGFVDTAPGHIRDPFGHGRAMDLWALIELAGRAKSNPVTDLATELLLAQVRSRDLDAWPFEEPRVSPRRP
jgi:aminoglycoside phosphotransferase (APT) family kinase protein